MKKSTTTTAAKTPAPTAPTSIGVADAGASPAKKPSLEARLTALEIKLFGHSPYATAAE